MPAQAIIAKNMRQAGWNVPLFQSHGFGNIKYAEAAGVAAEGIIFPASRLLVAESLPAGPQKDCLLKYTKSLSSAHQPDATRLLDLIISTLQDHLKKGPADSACLNSIMPNKEMPRPHSAQAP